MSIVIQYDARAVRLPAAAAGSLAAFRAWATSDAAPEHLRASYIAGEVLVDLSPEELETHNKVKGAVAQVVGSLVGRLDLGESFTSGALLTNLDADLCTEPDALFVSYPSTEEGRVRLTPREGFPGQFMEVDGAPDWVLEVVSRSSVRKDTVILREAYHRAGIPEYWLIDARTEAVSFQILRWQPDGYAAAPDRDGWVRSAVFDRSFRLTRRRNRVGRWAYALDMT